MFARSPRPAARPARRPARLAVTELERRDVPSGDPPGEWFAWTGAADGWDFYHAGNWDYLPPVSPPPPPPPVEGPEPPDPPGSQAAAMSFGGSAGFPSTDDHMVFPAGLSTGPTNMGPPVDGGWYASMSLSAGYGGTVQAVLPVGVTASTVRGGTFTTSALFSGGTVDQFGGTATLGVGGSIGGLTSTGGRLETGGGLGLATLTLDGGIVDQLNEYAGVTITSQLLWSAGTLNSTATASTVTVTGSAATATIAPANAGTVWLGSTLVFDGGATAAFRAGTVSFTGGAGIRISDATVVVELSDPPPGTVNNGTTQEFDAAVEGGVIELVHPDSKYHIKAVGPKPVNGPRVHGTALPITVEAGEFTVHPDVQVNIKPRPGPVQPGENSLRMIDGAIRLYGGSAIVAPNGVFVGGGAFRVYMNDPTSPTGTRADVHGRFSLGEGATLRLMTDPGGNDIARRGTFRVVGNVYWFGGTFSPRVQQDHMSDCYTWRATGSFTIGTDAWMVPVMVGGNSPLAADWKVLMAEDFKGAMKDNPQNLLDLEGYQIGTAATAWSIKVSVD